MELLLAHVEFLTHSVVAFDNFVRNKQFVTKTRLHLFPEDRRHLLAYFALWLLEQLVKVLHFALIFYNTPFVLLIFVWIALFGGSDVETTIRPRNAPAFVLPHQNPPLFKETRRAMTREG